MSTSDRRQEPDSLDAHRAARGPRSEGSPRDGGEPPEPASFEESPAVKRARHIEQLREIVDAGDYHPDPGKIAESMLENERS